jgi:hypothetical protein
MVRSGDSWPLRELCFFDNFTTSRPCEQLCCNVLQLPKSFTVVKWQHAIVGRPTRLALVDHVQYTEEAFNVFRRVVICGPSINITRLKTIQHLNAVDK